MKGCLEMNLTERSYRFNKSSVTVRFGTILDSDCEVIVSSDDCEVSQGGGISQQIAAAGGEALARDAGKQTPAELGGVVVTSAGRLPQKFVFHAVTIDFYHRLEECKMTDDQARDVQEYIVRHGVRRCLRLAAAMDVKSIAFPIIGIGAAHIPTAKSIFCMAETFAEELVRSGREMHVEWWLWLPEGDVLAGERLNRTLITCETLAALQARTEICLANAADSAPAVAGPSFGSASDGDFSHEVFISYSRKDGDSAAFLKIRETLDLIRVPYWIDVDGHYSGQNYKDVIVKAIRQANLVLFVSSSASNASENVMKEIDIASKERKKILPVRIDQSPYCDSIAYDLTSTDYIDMSELSAVRRLKEAVLLSRVNAMKCG